MKKTARVIITYKCNRNCPGCCNTTNQDVREISSTKELAQYEEVVITGGEPFLYPNELLLFIRTLKRNNPKQKIYIYTARLDIDAYTKVLNKVDGITVTLHAEATDDDIRDLKYMSENLWGEDIDMRLFIDTRVYEKYDFSNIRMSTWDVVRKLQWKDNCTPASNEDLLYLPLF